MIRRIFLDLDDACNTLAMHVLASVGCKVEPTNYQQYPREYGYDVVAAANCLLGETRYANPAAFWSAITRQNWVDTPESEIFPWILHRAAARSAERTSALPHARQNARSVRPARWSGFMPISRPGCTGSTPSPRVSTYSPVPTPC